MTDETKDCIKYGSLRTKITVRRVLWFVPNFSHVCSESKNIRSDVFSVSNLPNCCLFYLAITSNVNAFTVYLNRCVNSILSYKPSEYTANVMLSLEDGFGNLHFAKQFAMTKDTVCITSMYDLNQVHDVLIKGDLQVVCCVTMEETKIMDMQRSYEKMQNKLWSHCSIFSTNELKEHIEIMLDGDSSNKVVITIDEEDFPVHKSLLCSHSAVFSAMFSHETLENEQNRVFINDIRKETLGEMLKYIYTGCTSALSPHMNTELYIAADKYAISSLKDRCSKFLAAALNQELVLDVIQLAHNYNDTVLKSTAIHYLVEKAPDLLKTKDFLLFIESESEIVQSILLALVKQITT